MNRKRLGIALATAAIMGSAIAVAAFGAPLRLAAPALFGLHCAGRVCVENPEDLPRAGALVKSAMAEVQDLAGKPLPALSMVLCHSKACYRAFGGGEERAISFPFVGAVVAGPWQEHIIRHELIHWLQFEHYGAFETMSYPAWFREGMAYVLSGAPDADIPWHMKPWMAQFAKWQKDRPIRALWQGRPEFE